MVPQRGRGRSDLGSYKTAAGPCILRNVVIPHGEEPVYSGALAASRRDIAFVTDSDGGARRVELVVAINARTDPGLADQARAGALHRFEPLELAVPFTYHDPEERRFVLVVPSARGHEELPLRIELLRRLAEERAEIPKYVRAAETVVGARNPCTRAA